MKIGIVGGSMASIVVPPFRNLGAYKDYNNVKYLVSCMQKSTNLRVASEEMLAIQIKKAKSKLFAFRFLSQ
jgi:hypothetical protein